MESIPLYLLAIRFTRFMVNRTLADQIFHHRSVAFFTSERQRALVFGAHQIQIRALRMQVFHRFQTAVAGRYNHQRFFIVFHRLIVQIRFRTQQVVDFFHDIGVFAQGGGFQDVVHIAAVSGAQVGAFFNQIIGDVFIADKRRPAQSRLPQSRFVF